MTSILCSSHRAKAQALIQNLSLLLVNASVGTIQCLEEILCEFVQKDELKPAVTQVLWERATEKAPCSPLERCCSVMLLGMMARGKPEIVGSNLDTLVSIGLDEKVPQDYRLAQQVCHAIANLSDRRKPSLSKRHPPFRLPQEHRLFERLREVITKGFVHPDPLWIPFKEEAVTLIYQLAEGPEVICAQILQGCAKQALEKLQEKSGTQEGPSEWAEGPQWAAARFCCFSCRARSLCQHSFLPQPLTSLILSSVTFVTQIRPVSKGKSFQSRV